MEGVRYILVQVLIWLLLALACAIVAALIVFITLAVIGTVLEWKEKNVSGNNHESSGEVHDGQLPDSPDGGGGRWNRYDSGPRGTGVVEERSDLGEGSSPR